MSGKLAPFVPRESANSFSDLLDVDEGISPAEAGRQDSRESMAAARKILADAAAAMKLQKHA